VKRTKWQEKGVGFVSKKGQKQKKVVRSEQDGTKAGYHVEHWDDRQDAVVVLKEPVKLSAKVEKPEVR